jgi:hypothetical protein
MYIPSGSWLTIAVDRRPTMQTLGLTHQGEPANKRFDRVSAIWRSAQNGNLQPQGREWADSDGASVVRLSDRT